MKLLVIVTCFSPENAVGSIRLTKFVKYFVRNGVEVTVLSPELHEGTKVDRSLECDELAKLNRATIPQGKLFNKLFLKKRNNMLQRKSANQYIQGQGELSFKQRLKVKLFRYIQFVYTLLRNWDWKRQVVSYGNENFNTNEFDAVLTSYPSLGAPWAAIALKKKGIAGRLVTDFRDPIAYENNTTFIIYSIYRSIQRRIIRQSSSITYISTGVGEMLDAHTAKDAHVVTNGFDPDDRNSSASDLIDESTKLSMCYVGSLYGGTRDFSPLFMVLKELQAEGRLDTNNVSIIYAGTEAQVLTSQAKAYGLEDLIDDRGFVSRQESLNIQVSSDICLVSSWNSEKDKGIMTGKLFEYFTNNKMVIAVVNGTIPGSEIAQVINDVNAGFSLEVASDQFDQDKAKLKLMLIEANDSKQASGRLQHSYSSKIEDYAYDSLSKKFVKILKG